MSEPSFTDCFFIRDFIDLFLLLLFVFVTVELAILLLNIDELVSDVEVEVADRADNGGTSKLEFAEGVIVVELAIRGLVES